jgi:hypothetical protein
MAARRLSTAFILFIFWLQTIALVGCLVQANLGYPFRTSIALEPSKISHLAGHAYLALIPHRYLPLGGQAASSRVKEDALVSSLYSPNFTNVERVGSGIFSFVEGERLIFSATDNSDPRSNGRKYSVDLPLRIPRTARMVCVAVWIAATILQFGHPVLAAAAPAGTREAGNMLRRFLIFAGKWPLMMLSIPSIYLLLSYPPLWKDVDAVAQLILPAGAGNILHFPPVYCFLGRLLFLVAAWLPGVAIGGSPGSLLAEQHPTMAGIYLLILFQQILLVAALAYAVVSLTEDLALRGIFTLFLAACSSFYVYAHSCGSEGLSSATILATFASGISIIRGKGFVHWILYGLAIFLAAGCRQINVLFLFWLPSTLSVLVLVQRLGWCSSPRSTKRFKIIGLALLVGILAAGANIWIARTMIAAVHDEYRMTLGRTLSDRIDHFLARLTEQDRLRLAKAIASMTEDPEVQAAIMSQATIGSYYNGTNRQIAEELIRAGVPRAKIGFESDRVILAATTSYLASLHPVLLRAILQDFIAGFASASNEKIAYAAFDANKSGAQVKVERPDVWKAVVNWPALELPYATYLADRARLDPYISLQGSITLGFLAVLTIGICLCASFRSRRLTETATIALCILFFGALVYGANTVCVYYMDRYALPLFVSIAIALCASVAAHELASLS